MDRGLGSFALLVLLGMFVGGEAAKDPPEEPKLEQGPQFSSRPAFPDCNHNAVPDSMDLAEGTSDDVNRNGVADECDSDPWLREHRDDWRALMDNSDTTYFPSVHRHDQIIEIRYTVPPGRARVRLHIRDANGKTVKRLVDTKQPSDAYVVQWDRRGWYGVFAPPGTYELRLEVGKKSQTRRVRWNR